MTPDQLIGQLINDAIKFPWSGSENYIVAHNMETNAIELYGPTATKGWTYLTDIGITPEEASQMSITSCGRPELRNLATKTAALYIDT